MLEYLFDSGWQRFDGVFGFGSCKINEFGFREGESSSDEDGVEVFEVVVEGIGVVLGFCILVGVVVIIFWVIIEDKDEGDDEEDIDGNQFEERSLEFFFSIVDGIEDVDDDDQGKEDVDLCSDGDFGILIVYCDIVDCKFERQDSILLQFVSVLCDRKGGVGG